MVKFTVGHLVLIDDIYSYWIVLYRSWYHTGIAWHHCPHPWYGNIPYQTYQEIPATGTNSFFLFLLLFGSFY